jgi:hypothetical protein
MKTLKFNGEQWYIDERSRWKRVRQWIIWVGGWELANGKGWRFSVKTPYGDKIRMGPTPVSLFGHRITFYGWGWDIKIPRYGWLVWSRESGLYVSSNGTPPREDTKGFSIIYRKGRRL